MFSGNGFSAFESSWVQKIEIEHEDLSISTFLCLEFKISFIKLLFIWFLLLSGLLHGCSEIMLFKIYLRARESFGQCTSSLTCSWGPLWYLCVICWNMNSSEVFWIQISITDTGFEHFSKYDTLRCTKIIQYLMSLRLTFPLINKHWHKLVCSIWELLLIQAKVSFPTYLCCSTSFYALFLYSCLHLHLPF